MRIPASSHTLSVCLSVALATIAGSTGAADWPSWRGPTQNGMSTETGLIADWSRDGKNLLWRVDFSGRSTPVVVDGRVCATGRAGEDKSRQEMVACFDAASGKQLWERRFDVYNTTVPWNRVGWASPAADPETGYLYVQAVHGLLACLDARGEVVWSHNLTERFGLFTGYGGRTHTPTVVEDLVIVNVISSSWGKLGPSRDRLYAFDKRTGDVVWIATPGGPDQDKNTYSNPVFGRIAGRDQLISGNADGAIYAVEPRTGRSIWGFQLSKLSLNSTALVIGDTVIASHGEENIDAGTLGRVVAIDATGTGDVTTTHELWRIDELTAGYASPAYGGGRLWIADNGATLFNVDPKTGKVADQFKYGTVGKGSPVWADGRLYITEVNGSFVILDVRGEHATMADRASLSMADGRYAEIYGSPAIADGRIYFSTEEGLYALGNKANTLGNKATRSPTRTAKKVSELPHAAAGAKPTSLLIIPTDVLVAPGAKVTYQARLFDDQGLPIGTTKADWSLGQVAGEISANGELTVAADRQFQAGEISAKVGDLTATARVRVVGPFPWHDDFASYPVDSSVPHWLFSSRFKIAERDGEKVLTKPLVASGLQRTTTYLGDPRSSNYTIQIDLLGRHEKGRLPDMGLTNSGYTLDLMGTHQQLQVRAWSAASRMAVNEPFTWVADRWYTMKFRVDAVGDQVTVRAKVWPRGEVEPAAWTIEADDPVGVEAGSPGINGYSPVAIDYDNLVVTNNVALARANIAAGDLPVAKEAPAMFGGSPARNMVSPERGLPADWDVESGHNVLWNVALGSQAYGGPVVYGGKVFMGTNNEGMRNPKHKGDKGVVMAFNASNGDFLWQLVHDKLAAGRVNDWPLQGVCSTPFIDGNRLYYISNRAEVVCADTEGFYDNENDGPYSDEPDTDKLSGDIVWKYDMIGELDVFPHNLAASSPLVVDGLLFTVTGNGVDEGHVNIPAPQAPSFIALNAATGQLVWQRNEPGEHILHGSWSNPAYAVVAGQPQVVFPGGDGWVYSFEPKTGKLLWKFDCNPKDSVWELGGSGSRNNIISTPVIKDDRVYIAVGQDPEHGEGRGHLWAIDATKRGDISESGRVWHRGDDGFNRTISTVAIRGELLYAADLSGYLYALDLKTGEQHWRYNAFAAVWSSPFVADGRVYLTDEDGDVAILADDPKLTLLGEFNMGSAAYTTPVAREGVLFVATRSRLYALKQGIAAVR